MPTWKIAAVQMDCKLAEPKRNLAVLRTRLREAAGQGARLIIFPECALTGYCFESAAEALPFAEPLPGPATDALAGDCRTLGVFAAFGLLERAGDSFYNACALVGPDGFVAGYRKIHLPCLGVDHFSTPGDRPFAVHDLGGLRVGMTICYDGSFPESSRCLMLLGADLIVLPTNWPSGAASTIKHMVQCRALENNVYYAAVNRVGEERGFHFVGQSRLVACDGELLAAAGPDEETILYAEIDPAVARNKHIVRIRGKYEVDRVADRRPEMYGPLVAPNRPAGL
jgi:predicted amidohydrolase